VVAASWVRPSGVVAAIAGPSGRVSAAAQGDQAEGAEADSAGLEPGADRAHREAREELGIIPTFADPDRRASFITISETVGIDLGHTDASLWFRFLGRQDMTLITDPSEFPEARWWTPQVRAARSRSCRDVAR